jgi:hypothetical protein
MHEKDDLDADAFSKRGRLICPGVVFSRRHRVSGWQAQKGPVQDRAFDLLVAGVGLTVHFVRVVSRRICDAKRRRRSAEPASLQVQRSSQHPKMKRPALFEGRPFFILLAGA